MITPDRGYSVLPTAFRSPAGLRFLTRSRGKSFLRLDLLRSPFGTFMLACCHLLYVSIHLYPDLSAVLCARAGFGRWADRDRQLPVLRSDDGDLHRAGHRERTLSHRGVMILGAFLFGLYPLINGLAHKPYISSTSHPSLAELPGRYGVEDCSTACSSARRRTIDPAAMALHNLVLNLGILIGSLFGPALAAQMGDLRDVLFISAGLRFLAGVFFILWG